jgi:hypothetical protein
LPAAVPAAGTAALDFVLATSGLFSDAVAGLFSLTTAGVAVGAAAGASKARSSSGMSIFTAASPTLTSAFAVAKPNISTVYCHVPVSIPPN